MMNLFNNMEKTIIPSDFANTYDENQKISAVKAMSFDGLCYYFIMTNGDCVIKTNLKLEVLKNFGTKRKYSSFCYDYKEHCFWAASFECDKKIYKLDCAFKEIGMITIERCVEDAIVGVSYNCCNDTILIAFTQSVVELDKITKQTKKKYQCEEVYFTGICSLCPGFIAATIKDQQQYMVSFDSCGMPLRAKAVPGGNIIKSIIYNPCTGIDMPHRDKGYSEDSSTASKLSKGHFNFDVLVKSRCSMEIIKTKISAACIGFHPDKCNDHICNNSCDCVKPDADRAFCDVIESIALTETALSHILNAEGEKLQKVLAATDDIEKILEVNREVNRTIINVTHLEHTLYDKLCAVLGNHECECLQDGCNCQEKR